MRIMLAAILTWTLLACSAVPRPEAVTAGKGNAAGSDVGQFEAERDRLLQSVTNNPNQPDDWFQLAQIESNLGNGEAAASHLTHLARKWPELMFHVPMRSVARVVGGVAPYSDAELALLQALFNAQWNQGPSTASRLWFRFALRRVERGEIALARQVAEQANNPIDVVSMLMDKRFAQIVVQNSPAWDPLVRGQLLLDVLSARAAEAPADLEAQNEFLEVLLVMGQPQKVMEISDSLLQSLADTNADQSAYFRNWIENKRANALLQLGRSEEALAQLVAASKSSEHDGGNTSQLLNLAWLYSRMDMAEQALAALAQVEGMSDYGRMVEALVRHAASLRRGDREASAEALAYLREQRDLAPQNFLHALLCADLIDEAAIAVVESLRSPKHRSETLFWLQDLKQPPELVGDISVQARRLQLRERADVKAEVALFGSMGSYPIFER